MAIIKQLASYDGSTWVKDDIGANASNVSLTTNVAGQSNVQSALNKIVGTSALTGNKMVITNASGVLTTNNLTGERVVVTNSSGLPVSGAVTTTQLGYLSGVTSNVQTQFNNINNQINSLSNTFVTKSQVKTTLGTSTTDVPALSLVNTLNTNLNNKVDKSGDTMTGDLNLQSSNLILVPKAGNWEDLHESGGNIVGKALISSAPGTPPTANFQSFGGGVESYDKDNNLVYYSYTTKNTNDEIYRGYCVKRKIDDQEVYNSFYQRINANGDLSITFSNSGKNEGRAAWLKGLGLYNTGQNFYTPSAVTLPNATDKTILSATITVPGIYLVIGKVYFTANTTGRRVIWFSFNSAGAETMGTKLAVTPVSGAQTAPQTVAIMYFQDTPTLYLCGYQASGSSLTATGRIYMYLIHPV